MTQRRSLKWSELKVGLLVILAIGTLIAIIMNLEEGRGLITTKAQYRALVDHTQGLKVGSPVRMNGVDVGNVHRIAIAADSPKVEIWFTVDAVVAPHLREDGTVVIRPMGLLGDKFLDVIPGTPTKPPLPAGGLLAGHAEADLTSLAGDASTTFGEINAAVRELQRVLATVNQGQGTASKLLSDPGLYDRSQRVLEKLETASEKGVTLLSKVERGEGTIGQLVSDRELYNRANKALQDLTDLTSRLNDKNGTIRKLADPELYGRLDTLATRGEELLGRVEKGEGTIGKLVSRDDLYERMDRVLTDIEMLVADVKKNPTKYFKFSVF
ncbi:MAG TPA: MlaD family protein [Nitrospirales bacterium]|nr:MlaD family protein [Nitrospirales bacterium]